MKSERMSEHLLIAANQNRKERDYWLERLAGLPAKAEFYPDFRGILATPEKHKGDRLENSIQKKGENRDRLENSDRLEIKNGKNGDRPEMGECGFRLTGEAFAAIMRLSNNSDARLHMILTAAVVALLYKYQCGGDIITGTPIYRQQMETRFINTMLPLRHEVSGDMSYKDLLLHTRNVIKEAVEHQNYPLEILAEQLGLPMTPLENPLFDVIVLLENVQSESYLGNTPTGLLFSFHRTEERLEVKLKYRLDRYREETVRTIGAYFQRLISVAAGDVNLSLDAISLLDDRERQRLLHDFNGESMESPDDLPFHLSFRDRMEKASDNVAVLGAGYAGREPGAPDDVMLSYGHLNRLASRLASSLRRKGVSAGSVVAVLMDRRIEMIIAVLGIMKAGAAYLPLDPIYPADRVAYMLKDSAAAWLVTTKDRQAPLTEAGKMNVLLLQEELMEAPIVEDQPGGTGATGVTGQDPVYVIYTSGSTGKPKGVMVEHRQLVNAALAWRRDYRLDEIEVNLFQMASFSFDVFAGDIARTFISGGKMVINTKAVIAPETFHRLISIHRVTLLESTPSYIVPFMDYVHENSLKVPSLQLLILGSDTCPAADFNRIRQRFGQRMRIINSYGVTEATIDSSFYEEPDLEKSLPGGIVPIGKPMPNMQFYILDKRGELLPPGVPGELYIGGRGVTRGYLNNPALTAQRFPVKPSLSQSQRFSHRLYRTGDLGRWLADGNMEFLGRGDFQVKIRGYRIELGEIENKLIEHPGIREAVVLMKGERAEERYLCGYVVSDRVFDPAELRDYLARSLPEYMVPWFFITLEKLPLSANGKVDRKALPEPETQESRPYVPPSSDTEKKLVEIWSLVLKLDKDEIGVDTEFFDLGGNSLMAIVVASKIHKALEVRLQLTDIFQLQTIRAIGHFIDGTGREDAFETIPAAPEREFYPLSSAQKRLFFLQRMDKTGTVYNMPNMVRLDVDLEIEAVNRAFARLVRRHESLRTSFLLVEGEPVQKVLEESELEVEAAYFTPQSEAETAETVRGFIRPFHLENAPLVRIGIIRLSEGGYIFMADLHHIVSDGVSQSILVRDFISLYQGKALPSLRIHYKDYALWLLNQDYGSQGQYWLEEFRAPAPVLELPLDFPRPPVRSFQGRGLHYRLDSRLTVSVKQLASGANATLYMVLSAALNLLLSRYSGMEDIVTGAVTAGRRHADLDKVIGMFVNTLAMRHFPSPHLAFRQFLEQVKERSLKAYDNQDYPFETLIEALSLNRDTSRNPLFDVMLVLDTFDSRSSMEGETVTQDWGRRVSKFDLTFMCVDHGEELAFMVEYCTALFKAETIDRIFNHYRRVLETAANQPEILLSDIGLASEEEAHQLLEWANGPARERSHHLTLHGMFEEQAQRTPDHTALLSAVNRSNMTNRTYYAYLSYRELNRRADSAASALRDRGVGPGSIVAIQMDPCIEMITAIFGILKAGAAYLPIDPNYPQDRIDYMLTDSNAAVLVESPLDSGDRGSISMPARSGGVYRNGAQRPIKTERSPTSSNTPAYTIYTSGTTGRPKGVLVAHRGVINTLTCRKETYGFDHTWVMLQLFSFAFDGFVTGMFTPLVCGSRVILPAVEEVKDIKVLSSLVARHSVNHFISVPPLYRKIIMRLSPAQARSLRKVTLAGDVVSPDLPVLSRSRNPDMDFYLEYGVTEASVMSTIHKHRDGQVIQIGKPAWNARVHILDQTGRPQPAGVAGELCIGGEGVALGYLNRVELSAEKFRDGLYYSGDLGCWTMEGNIRFLGRLDHQVKIRGFRIETGEIENRLMAHEKVETAIVMPCQDHQGQRRLAAFMTLKGGEPENLVPQFRAFLGGTLPQYMIPAYFTVLETMPLTPNGKIDRKALSSINLARPQNGHTFVEPVTGMEKQVAAIWSEVLNAGKVGLHDNFFDLGGNSFDIMKISHRLETALNKDVPVVKLFKYPTVSALANYLSYGEAGEISADELRKISLDKARGKNRLKERSRRKRSK